MIIPNPEIYDPTEEAIKTVEAIYGLNPDITPETIEASYPPRDLPEGAMVTRMAPSPTGEMHIGSVYTALACAGLAKATNGKFFLRIEDTDTSREVEGAADGITGMLSEFDIQIDEGPQIGGEYGPYVQSERATIYQTFALDLVRQGKAYICFASQEEIEAISGEQEKLGVARGYYGEWAKWRNADPEKVLAELEKGTPFVIRLKNDTAPGQSVQFEDYLKGHTKQLVDYNDSVLIKSGRAGRDGKAAYLPTYHFAHVIDDHLMGTTHVIRGAEWLSSTGLHMKLFDVMGWEIPVYGHIATIDRKETGPDGREIQRKLSKRKDREFALVSSHFEKGYPAVAVEAYLMSILDSQFEVWRLANPDKPLAEYRFSPKGIKKSNNALYDPAKLADISKEEIGNMTAEEVYAHAIRWAGSYGQDSILRALGDERYALSVFGIERGGAKPRKDLVTWADIPEKLGFFFDELYAGMVDSSAISRFDHEVIADLVDAVISKYDPELSLDDWQKLMLEIAANNGFATDNKLYKTNPGAYRGSRADVFTIIRTLIAGRNISPDLYSTMKVIGKGRLSKRLVQSLIQLEPARQ